jgi:exodeoxyribonuclease VII small subunit
MASETFKQAYGVLQQHAQTLREQREPNIDDLLTIVTESVQAYKVCQQRIEAVEKALEKALGDTQSVPGSSLPALKNPAPAALPDDADDIPF